MLLLDMTYDPDDNKRCLGFIDYRNGLHATLSNNLLSKPITYRGEVLQKRR